MLKSNPKYVLRNYLVQEAIEKAEEGDYSKVLKLLEILENPFTDEPEVEFMRNVPQWALELCVSFSS